MFGGLTAPTGERRGDGKVDANYIKSGSSFSIAAAPTAIKKKPKVPNDPSTNIDDDDDDALEEGNEDIPEESSEQKAFRIQQKLSRQEWKGVHATLTTITKTHTKALADIEKLSKIHAEQMKNSKETIRALIDKVEFAIKQGINFDDIDYNKSSKIITTTTSDNNNKNHDKSKIIDRRLKPKIENNEVDTDSILQRILSKRPFPIEVIRMKEKKELEAKERKIRNIKRGLKGLGTSPIRTKKMNATRPGKKTSIKNIKQSPLVRRTKRKM